MLPSSHFSLALIGCLLVVVLVLAVMLWRQRRKQQTRRWDRVEWAPGRMATVRGHNQPYARTTHFLRPADARRAAFALLWASLVMGAKEPRE